jgi:drug/metabolite transporter (DMT)-like permease
MSAPRGRVLLALASTWLVWGSTYLFMRFAVETLPPVALAGVRYFSAGVILWGLARWRAVPEPREVPWMGHAVVGTLLTAGNASVALAVQWIPSGAAALLVCMTPCYMVLLEWLWRRGARPGVGVVAGLALGLAGTALLVGPRAFAGEPLDPVGAGTVLAGSACWAIGSIYSRTLPRHVSALRTSGVQMVSGGAVVLLVGILAGDLAGFDPSSVSFRSAASFAYLILVGSVLGYSSYMYLLGVTSAALASTYAFVNPVVAVILGALFASESLTPRMAAAGALIVLAVAMITLFGREQSFPPHRRRAGSNLEVREAP